MGKGLLSKLLLLDKENKERQWAKERKFKGYLNTCKIFLHNNQTTQVLDTKCLQVRSQEGEEQQENMRLLYVCAY